MAKRIIVRITLFLGFLLFVGTSSGYALVITSPQNGATFKEGDIVRLVAELSPDSQEDQNIGYVGFNVTKGIGHCPEKITTHPRYECSFTIPPGSPSVINIVATGATARSGAIDSQWVAIYVTLSPTVTLQGLKSLMGNRLFFSRIDQKRQIYINGIYSDGVDREIGKGSTGTTYASNSEDIVKIDADGLATAIAAGNAQITVRNGEKKLVLDVVVKPKL